MSPKTLPDKYEVTYQILLDRALDAILNCEQCFEGTRNNPNISVDEMLSKLDNFIREL